MNYKELINYLNEDLPDSGECSWMPYKKVNLYDPENDLWINREKCPVEECDYIEICVIAWDYEYVKTYEVQPEDDLKWIYDKSILDTEEVPE